MKNYKGIICISLLLVNILQARAQTNIASGKTVTSSSTFDPIGHPNSNLTDDNFTTFAKTGGAAVPPHAEWFMVDLGADYYIDSVIIGCRSDTNLRDRRFMLVTYPAALPFLGDTPTVYTDSGYNKALYNRLIYTDPTTVSGSGANTYGTTASNPDIPGIGGRNAGPVFPGNRLNLHVGAHKARYVLLFNLQDTVFDLTELQVYAFNGLPYRNLLNSGFETGTSVSSGNAFVREGNVPGWSTTDPVAMYLSLTSIPQQGSLIEFWRSGFLGVPAPEGNYFVELNSFSNGMLEQGPICVKAGEGFDWSFVHRGRQGLDVMALRINDIDVATFSDDTLSGGTHTSSVLTPATTTVASPTTSADGWTQWNGTWSNTTGSNLNITFGFRAISTGSGSKSIGNFLDNISITSLAATVSFSTALADGDESIASDNLPKLLVNGIVTSAGSVDLGITGGTAARGSDYTTVPASGNITIPIPVGQYDGTLATAISLAPYISIASDTIHPEPDETIAMTLVSTSSGALQIGDTIVCGVGNVSNVYTIVDAAPLPIELLTFNAQAADSCAVKLSWSSGSEDEVDYYQLEYSENGTAFLPAGELVEGKGKNSVYEQKYDLGETGSAILFRLGIHKLDKSKMYSKTLRVTNNCKNNAVLSFFPNPAKDKIFFRGLDELTDASLRIVDMNGRVWLQTNILATMPSINVSNLPEGVYAVQILSKGNIYTYRLLRQP